jgi:hypothetical protein
LGTSAKHRRRLPRADELLDDLDGDETLELELDADLEPDAELALEAAPRTLAPARAARRRGKPPRAGKASRAALSDDDLDVAEEWEPPERDRDRKRVEVSEPFKCRHCRAFVGIPPTGGRNRNHCPLCLYSLHVDGKTPGDRASDCRSLMAPIGTFYRPNLEQVVVHRCLGCGFLRYNRVAADDNPVVLNQLPVLDPAELRAAESGDQ